MQELIRRAKELLADGTVARVLGWKAGDMPWNPEPAFFENEEELKDFVYDGFCGANLSKMMIEASKLDGKTMVCLKPCDTYSFNQLLSEHVWTAKKHTSSESAARASLTSKKFDPWESAESER